ncbi:hypothetical protein [Nonomuraea sp. SBT364]|uniref:hypothetical protein n=1 Tax=Nonomuraea sp. SBT364 TaxID=1580530 RepID=UPI00066DA4C3|nr:hypothetical protein [Nonomuraea sp. SBT364]
MIQTRIHHDTLTVRFGPWARLFTRTAAVRVPLAAIAGVSRLDRPLTAAKGIRFGLLVTGVVKIGTWTSFSGVKRLVVARRDVPGLRITLKGRVAGHDELVLSLPDADELLRRLTAVTA